MEDKRIYNQKIIPDKIIEKKEIPDQQPPLPAALERALREAIHNNNSTPLNSYRRATIQQIIDGGFSTWSVGERNILSTLSLSTEIAEELRNKALEMSRKINPGDADPREVAINLGKLFDELRLKDILTDERVVVYSFGCGKSPEARAFSTYFLDRLERFVGYDVNNASLKMAAGLNSDPRASFELSDLSQGLPPGEPEVVIVRNPNIFLYASGGQNTPNPLWQSILQNTRTAYPKASILVTTLTNEEAKLASHWSGHTANAIHKNPYATRLHAQFGKLGTFDLPVACDAYYFFTPRRM